MTLSDLVDKVYFLYDSPIDSSDIKMLINEAQDKLSDYFHVEAHWQFMTEEGVDEYALHEDCKDVSDIIELGISRTTTPSDRYDFIRYRKSTRDDYPAGARGYYQVPTEDGGKRLIIYPVPKEDDLVVSVRYRMPLPELKNNDDVPMFPERYHMLLAFYAARWVCARSDTPDTMQADYFAQEWDKGLVELKRNRLKTAARHPRLARDNRHWHRKQPMAQSSLYEDDAGGGDIN